MEFDPESSVDLWAWWLTSNMAIPKEQAPSATATDSWLDPRQYSIATLDPTLIARAEFAPVEKLRAAVLGLLR